MTVTYAAIFIIGIAIGMVAQKYNFCLKGAFADLVTSGSTVRLASVGMAILVFSLAWLATDVTLPTEYPGARHFIGGVIQGVGYILAAGCPLALLVRTGQGSKFHFTVIPAFLLGAAIFSALKGTLLPLLLSSFQYQSAVSLVDLFK